VGVIKGKGKATILDVKKADCVAFKQVVREAWGKDHRS